MPHSIDIQKDVHVVNPCFDSTDFSEEEKVRTYLVIAFAMQMCEFVLFLFCLFS